MSELSDRWQISERHVRRLIANSDLPVYRFGRAVRVDRKEVEVFEARCATTVI